MGLQALRKACWPYEIKYVPKSSYCPSLVTKHNRMMHVTATINRVISMTMSVVLDVTFQTHQDPPVHRVLKLYDRQFDSDQREVGKDRTAPHTLESEAAFEGFVKRGMMPGFLSYREKGKKRGRNAPRQGF